MKVLSAYFLMAVTLFNCFGAYFSFKTIKHELIEIEMSAKESQIAIQLNEETGSEFHLAEIDPNQLNMLGYVNSFVIHKKVNGESVYMQILPTGLKVEKTVTEEGREDKEQRTKDAQLLQLLMPPYVLNKASVVPSPLITQVLNIHNSFKHQSEGINISDTNTPPPRLV